MAAETTDAQLVRRVQKGDKGAFEWKVNGELVYSKHATGRYPELKEIKEAVYSLV